MDEAGDLLPLEPDFHLGWELLALSGGGEMAVAGLWNGEALSPLSACADGRWVNLAGGGAG